MEELVTQIIDTAENLYMASITVLAKGWSSAQDLAGFLPELSNNETAVLSALTIGWIILINGMFLNLTYLLQLTMAYKALRRRGRIPDPTEAWWRLHEQTLPMSILVPAYAEEATIVESVRSLLALQYPTFEIIVVCDGSPDGTLDALVEAFDLQSTVRAYDPVLDTERIRGIYEAPRFNRLLVIDKDNGGKADALNAAINVARCPLVCAVDADSLLESDSLLRVVQPFVEDVDKVVAVGGTIRIANGCTIERGRVTGIHLPKDILSLFQIIEYLRAFLMARLGWSELGSMMMVSGAFGIFKKSILLEVDGYSRNTVGEDMEIILKIHRLMSDTDRDYQMKFIPEPVCWTEAPRNLKDMGNQRKRWARGSLESFFRHRDLLGRFKYGAAGTLGYLNILITDVLGPPLEILGYLTIPILYSVGLLNLDFLLAFLGLTFVFGIFLSVGSLILEEMELKRYSSPWDLAVLTYVAVIENFGYRQLNNIWRVIGWWQFIRGKKSWGSMTRSGFS